MFNSTVDSANTRTWSSDYLDLVEGTVLLLGEYEMRPESEEYRREHDRIAASASANMRRLSRQLALIGVNYYCRCASIILAG